VVDQGRQQPYFRTDFFLAVPFSGRGRVIEAYAATSGRLERALMSVMAGSPAILPWPLKRSLQSRVQSTRLCDLFSAQTR
jgi:hypothetical protein